MHNLRFEKDIFMKFKSLKNLNKSIIALKQCVNALQESCKTLSQIKEESRNLQDEIELAKLK